jgi:hypothetical protein
MSNRWLRFGIAILALGAAAAAGLRFFQQQQRLADSIREARVSESAAETVLATIAETRAAQHAYVAEGQSADFWTTRVSSLLEKLRSSILALETPAAAAGASLTESLDLTDRLAASDERARDHLEAGQRLLAGEIVFTEARDALDALQMRLGRARLQVLEAAENRQNALRRELAVLGLGATGVMAFAILLLAVPGKAAAAPAAPARATAAEAPDQFESSARIISRTPITLPAAHPAPAAAKAAGEAAATASRPPAAPVVTAAPLPRAAIASPAVPPISLRDAAAVCTELGRASQSIEVSNLLARGAKVLNAAGLVVWMTSPDGRELYPAASAGYDERLLARIGNIPRSASNVTAGALRDANPRTSPRMGQSAAALAVPLLTPLGAVGVLSAELKGVEKVDDTRLAVATIFAAQLATLIGSMTAPAGVTHETARSVM